MSTYTHTHIAGLYRGKVFSAKVREYRSTIMWRIVFYETYPETYRRHHLAEGSMKLIWRTLRSFDRKSSWLQTLTAAAAASRCHRKKSLGLLEVAYIMSAKFRAVTKCSTLKLLYSRYDSTTPVWCYTRCLALIIIVMLGAPIGQPPPLLEAIPNTMCNCCIGRPWLGNSFYPNVTTLRSGLCYRKSVCRL